MKYDERTSEYGQRDDESGDKVVKQNEIEGKQGTRHIDYTDCLA